MNFNPYLSNQDYYSLKTIIGKVIRVAVIPSSIEINPFDNYSCSIISLGITEIKWTPFEWIVIQPVADKDSDQEHLFRISTENQSVLRETSTTIIYPNGWTFEKLNNATPLFLNFPVTFPVSKIKLYQGDSFNNALIFEHAGSNNHPQFKWCIINSIDSAKPFSISFSEEQIKAIESGEMENILEIY